jgi:hypothetical protein
MRVFLPLAAAALLTMAATAQAQVTAPVTIAPQGAAPRHMNAAAPMPNDPEAPSATTTPRRPHMTAREHFDAANVTHDGRLTPEQAQAAWPNVARHFSDIDKDHRGYVTLDEVRTYRREHRHHNNGAATPEQ